MNVLVINGSPRLAASNTMKLTNAFISAAPQDAVIKTVQIYKKKYTALPWVLFLLGKNGRKLYN